jgi:hypothetical protein
MNTYILKFLDGTRRASRPIRFVAEDRSDAYVKARNEALGRQAQLWSGRSLIFSFTGD